MVLKEDTGSFSAHLGSGCSELLQAAHSFPARAGKGKMGFVLLYVCFLFLKFILNLKKKIYLFVLRGGGRERERETEKGRGRDRCRGKEREKIPKHTSC